MSGWGTAVCSGVSGTGSGGEDAGLGGVPRHGGAVWQHTQHCADVRTDVAVRWTFVSAP